MGIALTEVKKVCYCCGIEKSKAWYPNRDLVTWLPMNYLCYKCAHRLIYWPEQFRDPARRVRHRETANRTNATKRVQLIQLMGGRCVCSEKDCWHEGACTVSDIHCLQVEHKNGGGTRQYKTMGAYQMYLFYAEHPVERERDIQVYCANCNWKKKHRLKEHRGRVVELAN